MIPFTQASHHASAQSPSISLERGNYRMRAPIIRPPALNLNVANGKVERGRTSSSHRLNRNLAFLLVLLALACISCFGSAYYLFTTRWELEAISVPPADANSISQVNASITNRGDTNDEHAKYLSYLPHSGFHNQRIAFENALLLAYLLRRTLLVPPIRLGNKPIRYVDFEMLSQFHELSSKTGLSHCPKVPAYTSRPAECLHYFDTTYIAWNWLVNLSAVEAHQRLVHRPDMSGTWVKTTFGFGPSDTLTLRDSSPYQFRFLDTVNDSSPTSHRYMEDIYVAELAKVKVPLLQIGTLFGSSRLRLRNPVHLAYRSLIRQNMIFANDELMQAADSISRVLKGNYIGVHLRSGDGKFKAKVDGTVKSIWWNLLFDVFGFSVGAICDQEIALSETSSPSCLLGNLDGASPKEIVVSALSASAFRGKCRSSRHRGQRFHQLNIPVYVSTDIQNPATHPLLRLFRQTFPCIFFLEDFTSELAHLERLKSPYDDVHLWPFLSPFVDALVVGKAMKVVGT
ncbi:hypothetical protein B0H34DRAFT_698581 [Crassisporium funariophilum]|nr:hypothetical protein B0H34DRAFT_698581 [Crassisporium funariophilum]